MRKLITTIALLALIDTSVAIAQTVGSRNPSAPPPSTNPDRQLLPEAPVGHRQPRADQVPSDKNLVDDPNDRPGRRNKARWSTVTSRLTTMTKRPLKKLALSRFAGFQQVLIYDAATRTRSPLQ
jgi:hypothetical protein